jgi:hypothetical protein
MSEIMETRPIVDNGIVPESFPTDSAQPEQTGTGRAAEPTPAGDMRFPGEDGGKSLAAMAQRDLVATLQLLAERAQYITGATGAAIALRHNGEMTCRASAGTSAPEVGAHLQVDSGLSGESIRSMKTLRCDDAATDTRVNRESCETLGIASVVVMPLVRGNKVIGVFELFSDKAHVFEARDITALERMGAMVFTALEHALTSLRAKADAEFAAPVEPEGGVAWTGNRPSGDKHAQPSGAGAEASGASVQAPEEVAHLEGDSIEQVDTAAASETTVAASYAGVAFHMKAPAKESSATPVANPSMPEVNDPDDILGIASEARATSRAERQAGLRQQELDADVPLLAQGADKMQQTPRPGFEEEMPVSVAPVNVEDQAPPTARTAVSNLRRCEGCGFPVSEGRQYCFDCARKTAREQQPTAKNRAQAIEAPSEPVSLSVPSMLAAADDTPMPRFLHDEPQQASWIATHKFTVGVFVVVVAGIVIFLLTR